MIFSFLLLSLISSVEKTYSCQLLENGTVTILEGFQNAADSWVSFNDSYSEIGWGKVHIWTNSESPSYNQMYCAGFADAYSTHKRIGEAYRLYKEAQLKDETEEWPAPWREWFSLNINYMRRMTAHPADDYWRRTALILAQFDGMVAGYNAAPFQKDDPSINELDFWILQSAGDLDDLDTVLAGHPARDPELTLKCTGLIFLDKLYNDIYFAQDTWSDYRDLHAYLKEYNLNIPEFKSHRVTISTRTGKIASVDDFWTNDKGLLVLETTMHCFNHTLYKEYVRPESVLTWIRSYHTMFATDNGKEWTEHFIRENSGTYNNEYIVLDTKKFQKGVKPDKDLLWIIEQFPGNYRSQDITTNLTEKTFYQSINTPVFEDLFILANYTEVQKEDPQKADFWSYEKQPRNQIIIHNAAKNITDYETFKAFMRYNDYKNDKDLQIPYLPPKTGTWAEPAQGILSRYDLRPTEGTPYGAKNHFGGLDTKAASVTKFVSEHSWDAILAPENVFNQPFDFDQWPDIHHYGITNLWDQAHYGWTQFSALDYCAVYGGKEDEEKCTSLPGCGFCIFNQKCMLGSKSGPSDSNTLKCEDGWTVKQVNPSYTVPLVASVTTLVVIFVAAIYGLHFYQQKKKSSSQYQNF